MLSSINFYTLLRTLMHSECFVWFGLGFFFPLRGNFENVFDLFIFILYVGECLPITM